MEKISLFISLVVGILNIINLSFSINKHIADYKKKHAKNGSSKRAK